VGYESVLHLVNIKVKDDSRPVVEKSLKMKKGRGLRPLVHFLEQAVLDGDGCLCFKSTGAFESPYVPDEDEGTVPALSGKWRNSEKIAGWLKLHSQEGGRLIHHSCEGDGVAWGWEFDGRGRMRELALCSVGEWE
jgi:hypothetical protein